MTEIFRTILSMSIGAGVLGVMVLFARAIIGRRQTVAITLMFALLIARLIVPLNIESKASIFNLVPSEFAQTDAAADTGFSEADNIDVPVVAAEQDFTAAEMTQTDYKPLANDTAAKDPVTAAAQNIAAASEAKQPRSIDYWQLAAYAWIAGMAVLALVILVSNALFTRKVRGNRDYASPELSRIIDECAAQFGIKQKICAIQMSEINNVAVCGIFRPKLLISPEAYEGLTIQEKRDVIMHEMSHIKRKDTLTSLILTIVSVLHWFNPVVWIAFAAYRKDMEVMCDIKVLSMMQNWQRRSYAQTLLKLAKTSNGRNPKLAMALFMSKSSIKRRIIMIARYKKNKPVVVALALILALGIAVTGCTGRITDGPEETQGQEPTSIEQQNSANETQEQQTIEPELLASYTFDYSEYANDQARVDNIRKAALALNGVTIAPDEQLGIIKTIGSITLDEGWQKAPGITWETISRLVDYGDVNNELALSDNPSFEQVGGGVDLVAAAFCIAAIDAGMDEGMSWNSGYIYDGDAGLHNWFDSQVVFETIQEDNNVTVNIYGPNYQDQLWRIGMKIAEQAEGEITQVQTEYGNRIGQFSIDFSFCADNKDIVNNINLAAKETDGKVFKQGMGERLLDDSISKEDGWRIAPAKDLDALCRLTFDTIDSVDLMLTSYELGGGKELVACAIKGAALKAGLSVGSFNPYEDIINEYYGDVTLRVFVDENVITAEFYCDNPTFPQMMSSYSYDYQGRYLDESFLNVDKALSKLGIIEIAPGEEISLNEIVGNRANQDGWVAANDIAVKHNETEAGGGACIAATAIYNAAILAELEVTEVTHHGILPNDMPPGLDATFSYDNGDLKIKNPYNVKVYIESGFREGNIVSSVYGPIMDYKVGFSASITRSTIPEPEYHFNEITVPGGGVPIPVGEAVTFTPGSDITKVVITKKTLDMDGKEISSEVFDTVEYEPYPAQIYVNADTVPDDIN